MEMIERLLFVRIQREAANGAIGDLQLAVDDAAAAADARVAFFYVAVMGAAFTIHNS